jgi:hypothetical protein
MFRGQAPTEFVGNTHVSRGFSLDTDDPAAMLYSKLQRFARQFPGAKVIEGEIDAKGNVLSDKFSITEIAPRRDLAQAEALCKLPVHLSSIRIEAVDICEGLRLHGAYVFCNLRIVSAVTTGILSAWLRIKTKTGNCYTGAKISKLSDWVLVEPFFDPRFSMSNTRDVPLETLALQTDRLAAGEGIDTNLFPNISHLMVELEDGNGSRHKLDLPSRPSWPTTSNKILHCEFRRRG